MTQNENPTRLPFTVKSWLSEVASATNLGVTAITAVFLMLLYVIYALGYVIDSDLVQVTVDFFTTMFGVACGIMLYRSLFDESAKEYGPKDEPIEEAAPAEEENQSMV